MMRTAARRAYVWLSGALVVDVVAQVHFAGVGFFTFPGTPKSQGPRLPEFALHSLNGTVVVPALILLTLAAAALAGAPGRTIALTAAPIGLLAMQVLFFVVGDVIFGEDFLDGGTPVAYVFALHAVNALLILWTVVTIFRRARALAREPRPEPATVLTREPA